MQTYRTCKHQVARSTHSTGPKNDALKIEGKWFHYHGPLQFEVPGLATFRLHGGASRVRNPNQRQSTGLAATQARNRIPILPRA